MFLILGNVSRKQNCDKETVPNFHERTFVKGPWPRCQAKFGHEGSTKSSVCNVRSAGDTSESCVRAGASVVG